MLLINCEINLLLTWSANCVISEGDRETTFAITDTKLYVPVVTLSSYYNNLNQGLDTLLTGINIDRKYQQKDQINTWIT